LLIHPDPPRSTLRNTSVTPPSRWCITSKHLM
jgi:hypothetical protein